MDRTEFTQPVGSSPLVVVASSNKARLDRVQRVARAFQVAYDENNLDLTEDSCVKAVVEACKRKQQVKIREHADDVARVTDLYKRTVLMHLVSSQNLFDIAQILVRGDVTGADLDGNTALHFAAECGNIWSVKGLLGYVPHVPNRFGETPLHLAIREGHDSLVSLLLQKGVDGERYCRIDSSPARDGSLYVELSALGFAVVHQKNKCVDEILKLRPLLLEMDCGRDIGSVLHVAVQFGKIGVLRHLLSGYICRYAGTSRLAPNKGEDLFHKKDGQGRSPLSLAACLGNVEAIEALKEAGADLEVKDRLGCPLHYAAIHRQAGAIELLLSLGANSRSENNLKNRPIDYLSHSARDEKTRHCRGIFQHKAQEGSFPEPIEYLVFEGGGPKGLAYAGVLLQLDELGELGSVREVAGTSAGAITALLVALRYTGREVYELMVNQNIIEFLESPTLNEYSRGSGALKVGYQAAKGAAGLLLSPARIWGAVGNLGKFMAQKGICSGEVAREWIEELIYKKTGIHHLTMGELRTLVYQDRARHLHVFGTRTSSPKIMHFSSKAEEQRNYIVSDLVSLSTRIPGAYEPHTIHVKEGGARLNRPEYGSFVDGGLLRNFPIDIFDANGQPNRRTLGFCFYSSTSAPPPLETNQPQQQSFITHLINLGNTYYQAEALYRKGSGKNEESTLDDSYRTIKIDVKSVRLLSFMLSAAQKEELILSGKKSTLDFLQARYRASEERVALPEAMSKFRPELSQVKENDEIFPVRESLLDAMNMCRQNQTFLRRTVVCVLRGPEGFGKQELAYAFAQRFQDEFSIIRKISCETDEGYLRDYFDLAKEDFKQAGLDVGTVNRWLSQGAFDKPWLLILSNANANRELALPKKGGIVIITTSENLNINSALLIDVPPLTRAEALHAFRIRIRPEQGSDAELEALASALGYNPRQIGIAADYIRRTSCAVSDYVDPSSAQAAALNLLKIEDPIAYDFLSTCAYFYFDRISISLVKKWLKLAKQDRDSSAMVDSLVSRFFARRGGEKKAISLLPGVQKILKDLQGDENCTERYYHEAVSLLAHWLVPEFQGESPDQQILNEGLNHVNQLMKYSIWKEAHPANRFNLLLGLASWLEGVRGDPRESLFYCKDAKKIAKELGKEELALALSQLGRCLLALGEPRKALAKQDRAIGLMTDHEGPERVDFLCRAYSQKGNCLLALGFYEAALDAYGSGQKLREKVFHRLSNPCLEEREAFSHGQAGSYNKIARTLLRFKNREKAEEALQNVEKALGLRSGVSSESAAVAKSYQKIGKCYLELGENLKALHYTDMGLELLEKLRGQQSPRQADATIRNKMARCHLALKQYAEALRYYSEALKYRQQLFGDRHRSTATSFKKVGRCQFLLKNYPEALAFQQQSLKIRRELFGTDAQHPSIANNLSDIADCLLALSRQKQAFEIYILALKINLALKNNGLRLARNVDQILACLQLHPQGTKFEELKKKLEVMLEIKLGRENPLVYKVRQYSRVGFLERQRIRLQARL